MATATWFFVREEMVLTIEDLNAKHFIDGEPFMVARAWHEQNLLPGHLKLEEHAAYFSYQGQSVRKREFQVLLGGKLEWRFHSQGEPLPANALQAGRTCRHEPLFVGRIEVDGIKLNGHVRS
ncbi:Hypothetical predicted protein [Cloeon dipterum]|uniref:Uncharacterized protein n=1 Tax=Cloeon dipterum TaxID=197152 RepID=A0A8S1E1R9_9INSE|nr:Hypothetical predicted protein [Cloeon dipterum]